MNDNIIIAKELIKIAKDIIAEQKNNKSIEKQAKQWIEKTGIELIHKQSNFEKQKQLFYNWQVMPKKLKEKSDRKCNSLFHCSNLENHIWIMENEWHNENYFELNNIRQMYDTRDMEENNLKYIHVSLSDKPIIFTPRIPKNVMTFKGKWKLFNQDKNIARICCSDSIFSAIGAINIKENKTYYVHLLQPKKIINNREVMQYVPDASATGQCWILDEQIKSTVIGKLQIGNFLPYVYLFLKDENNFKCTLYHDYTFFPYESLFKRKIK